MKLQQSNFTANSTHDISHSISIYCCNEVLFYLQFFATLRSQLCSLSRPTELRQRSTRTIASGLADSACTSPQTGEASMASFPAPPVASLDASMVTTALELP